MRAFGLVLAACMLVLPLAAVGQPGTDSVRILAAMRKSAADWNRATEGPTTPQIETDVTGSYAVGLPDRSASARTRTRTAPRPVEKDDFSRWMPRWDGYDAFYGRSGRTALPLEVAQMTWSRARPAP